MDLGEALKKTRELKGLSQKQVAAACKMDTGNYSRIENGKTDPSFSSVVKIARALGVNVTELFKSKEVPTEVRSLDKSLQEKLSLIETLDKKEKRAFFTMLDALVAKKRLKDMLSSALSKTG